MGIAALALSVGAAAWLAVGAADGRRWLELPAGGNPRWIEGPLHGLARGLGSLAPSSLSAGLIVMLAGYLLALACSRSIPLPLALGSIGLANAAFMLGPTIVSTDVFGYIAYAREAALHGLSPYLHSPSSIPHDQIVQFVYWKHQTSPYGPLFTFVSLPLGLVSVGAALWSYKVAAGIAGVAIAVLCADIGRRRGVDPARAAIFVGLNPVLLFYAVSGAHNDLLAVALMLCAITLALRAMEGGAAAATAVAAAAIKATLGLALPFVLILAHRRGRAVRGAALAVIAIGIPALLLFGSHLFGQLHRIAADSQFDIAFSGPDRLATLLGTHIDTGVRVLCTAAAATVALIAIDWAWRGGDPIAGAGWAFAALLACIASLAPWYLVWLLPLAAAGHSRSLRIVALLATCYLIGVHLPALGGEPWLSHP